MKHPEFRTRGARRQITTLILEPADFNAHVSLPILQLFDPRTLLLWSKERLKDYIVTTLDAEAGPRRCIQHDLPAGHTLAVAMERITCADGCPRTFSIVRRSERSASSNVPPLILTTDKAHPQNRFGLKQKILFGLRPRTNAD